MSKDYGIIRRNVQSVIDDMDGYDMFNYGDRLTAIIELIDMRHNSKWTDEELENMKPEVSK